MAETYEEVMKNGTDVVAKKSGMKGKRVLVGTINAPAFKGISRYYADEKDGVISIFHTKYDTKLAPEVKAQRAKERKAVTDARKAKILAVKKEISAVKKTAITDLRAGKDVSKHTAKIGELEAKILEIKSE